MVYFPLNDAQKSWLERAEVIGRDVLAPAADQADRTAEFPRRQLDALKDAGFFGLRADPAHGGVGEGLLTTCLVTEALAKSCPSTSLIYKMHLESIEMISRAPTPIQAAEVLPKLASGEWLSTVAGSEVGHQGGAWAGAEKASVEPVDGGYQVANIRKSFVTGAGHTEAFFFMCTLRREGERPQQLMFQVQRDDLQWSVDEPWDGLGMRANHSSPMTFNGFIPQDRLLNPDNQRVDLMPVVLGTYAATYLGIAGGCYDALHAHIAGATLADGRRMGEVETIQTRMAHAKVGLERSRALLYSACAAFDANQHGGPLPFFEAKVACDEVATHITQDAMTLGGGAAFAKRLPFERYFRDARAGMVMGIAHDIAVLTVGKMLFPKPKEPKESKPKEPATS
ncbi:MAG: acyl-CoA dehydrogenase family protein [Acidimicrobiales bacterium]